MITIVCQHSGLEFEAKSKRTKQHPEVAALKAQAHKDGNYTEVLTTLSEARKQTYTTVAEYLTIVSGLMCVVVSTKKQALFEKRVQEKEEKMNIINARKENEQINRVLKSRGYTWTKEETSEEDMDYIGPNAFEERYGKRASVTEWTLYTPDGVVTSVEDAMAQINK